MDSVLEDKELMKMHVDLQKRFPIYHVCPKCLAALLCGAAIRGFLGVAFISLRDVVVVGLITCERVVLGKSAKVLVGGSAQEFVHHILEDEVVGQKEEQGDKRQNGKEREENGVLEERAIRHNNHNAHEAWMW